MTNDVSAFYNIVRLFGFIHELCLYCEPSQPYASRVFLGILFWTVEDLIDILSKHNFHLKDELSSSGEGGKKKMSPFVNALSSIGAQQTSEHMMENQPGATQMTS
nr:hypothetical protein [Tanacetum cinerariifolium]